MGVKGFEDEKSLCFKYFSEISKIPRKSFHEEQISAYLVQFAEDRGLWVHKDALYNVIMKVPGTSGRENEPPLLIQSHTDMVCQKDIGSPHDFLKDPIEFYADDEGMLWAKGTTLGADDGTGVAMMLGLLDEPNLSHPPLEMVFTSQEEFGVGGAQGLDFSLLSAKRMIGLDGSIEGSTMVSATDVLCERIDLPLRQEPTAENGYHLSIVGMTSGHGGLFIGAQRASANKTCARILHHLNEKFGIRLNYINGGNLMHAISRDAEARFVVDGKIHEDQVIALVNQIAEEIRHEYSRTDPNIKIKCKPCKLTSAASKKESDAAISLMYLLPTGAVSRTPDTIKQVEGSYNLSIIEMNGEDEVFFHVVSRANYPANARELSNVIHEFAKVFGAPISLTSSYPGHYVAKDSPLVTLWAEVYKEDTDKDLIILYEHCGLDAGSIFNGLQMNDLIMVVPNIYENHTSTEHLDIDSYYRAYEYLKRIVERC